LKEKQIKNEVMKLNILIAKKKAKLNGWEYSPRMLVKKDKDLKRLRQVIIHLLKTNTLEYMEEYVDFAIRYYSKSQFITFPPVAYFSGNKVKNEWQKQGIDFMRFSFKPITNGFKGPIWNKREATYYGFPEEDLLDEVERSFSYMKVAGRVLPLLGKEEFTIDKNTLGNIELILASMIRQRGVYINEIPKFYKLWKYSKEVIV